MWRSQIFFVLWNKSLDFRFFFFYNAKYKIFCPVFEKKLMILQKENGVTLILGNRNQKNNKNYKFKKLRNEKNYLFYELYLSDKRRNLVTF